SAGTAATSKLQASKEAIFFFNFILFPPILENLDIQTMHILSLDYTTESTPATMDFYKRKRTS
ncbi:MAG: hypothetical protein IKT48_02365, partial [Anaerotignum sp.]|nr:hypothetical protein [Anaerotignum sp.]